MGDNAPVEDLAGNSQVRASWVSEFIQASAAGQTLTSV